MPRERIITAVVFFALLSGIFLAKYRLLHHPAPVQADASTPVQYLQGEELRKALVANPSLVRERNPEGRPLLSLVFSYRHPSLEDVEIMLRAGSDAKVVDNQDCNVLHYAVYSGTPEILEELVSAGADVNKKDRLGHTPLRNAMFVRETKITDKLLALGASLDVRTAAALGKTEEVSRFISADPQALDQEDADGYSAIDWAARRHQREVLILMARTHPRVNIFRAAALGDERSVSDGLHTAPGSINSRFSSSDPLGLGGLRGQRRNGEVSDRA